MGGWNISPYINLSMELFSGDFSFFFFSKIFDVIATFTRLKNWYLLSYTIQSLQIIYRGCTKPFCLWLNNIRYLKWRISKLISTNQQYIEKNNIISITVGHAAVYKRTALVHQWEQYTCGMPHFFYNKSEIIVISALGWKKWY